MSQENQIVAIDLSGSNDLGLGLGGWDGFTEFAQGLDVALDGFADGGDGVVAGGAGGDAAGEIGHVNAEGAVVGGFDDDGVLHGIHFSPACRRMERKVPGATSCESLPPAGTVTRPGLVACF